MSNGKVSEKLPLTPPRMWARKRTLNALIAEILSMCQNDSCVIVLLNPDVFEQPGQPFLVLEAGLRRNINIMDKHLPNVVGTYGRGIDQSMIIDDLEASGIMIK